MQRAYLSKKRAKKNIYSDSLDYISAKAEANFAYFCKINMNVISDEIHMPIMKIYEKFSVFWPQKQKLINLKAFLNIPMYLYERT